MAGLQRVTESGDSNDSMKQERREKVSRQYEEDIPWAAGHIAGSHSVRIIIITNDSSSVCLDGMLMCKKSYSNKKHSKACCMAQPPIRSNNRHPDPNSIKRKERIPYSSAHKF